MKRIALLALAVFVGLGQKGDSGVRIKAFVCEKDGRDYCGKRHRQGFEPSRIRLEAYLRHDVGATDMQYGIVCAGEDEPRARSIVDLTLGPSPVYAVEHPDIAAGECWGVAVVYRRNQEPLVAKSEPIRILALDN
jgi:hypothetical protein